MLPLRAFAPLLASILGTFILASACTAGSDLDVADDSRWHAPEDSALATLLQSRMAESGVGMVVGVVDGNRRSVVAHGRSGAPDGRALDDGTVFQLGSLTKVITTLLLAEMVVRGDVGLDDPVNALLPVSARIREVGSPISLRHLATHTSGLPSMPSNFDIRGAPDPYAAYTVDQLWTFLSSFEPTRAPGTAYEYSNLGVSLLGRVLAMKAGTTYEALVKERVLDPLDMRNTSIALSDSQRARLAPGHGPYAQPIDGWEMVTLQASGSLRSTAEDMLNLLELYLGKRSAPESLVRAARLQLDEGVTIDSTFHPLGLGRRPDGTYRHAGGKEGYRSGLAFNPKTGVGAVALANARTFESEPMSIALHVATGESLPPAPTAPPVKSAFPMTPAALDRFAGRYRADDGAEWEIVVADSLLRIRYPNNSIFDFVPSAPNAFFYNAGNDDIAFEVDATGRVTRMTVYGDGRSAGGGQTASRVR